jgi:hypothetical protein
MPRYEETDFPPDIEVMVAASNWCLAPSPQGWKRLRDAVAAGQAMPADMGPVLDAIEAVRGLCDGHRLNPEAQAARERLSTIVERVAHGRRVKANDIRRGGKVAARVSPAKAAPAPMVPAEEVPEDARGQWWQR